MKMPDPQTITVTFRQWGARATVPLVPWASSDKWLFYAITDQFALVCIDGNWGYEERGMRATSHDYTSAQYVIDQLCRSPETSTEKETVAHLAAAYPPDCETMAEMLKEEGWLGLHWTVVAGKPWIACDEYGLLIAMDDEDEWQVHDITNHGGPMVHAEPHEVLQLAREFLTSLPPDEQAVWRGSEPTCEELAKSLRKAGWPAQVTGTGVSLMRSVTSENPEGLWIQIITKADNNWRVRVTPGEPSREVPAHLVLQEALKHLDLLGRDERAKWRGEPDIHNPRCRGQLIKNMAGELVTVAHASYCPPDCFDPPVFMIGQELHTREQCVAALREGWDLWPANDPGARVWKPDPNVDKYCDTWGEKLHGPSM